MTLHPEFRFNGVQLGLAQLAKKSQELIDHGRDYEIHIGKFLKAWLSEDQTIAVNTSGSTGVPKTIHLSKRSMIRSARNTAIFFGKANQKSQSNGNSMRVLLSKERTPGSFCSSSMSSGTTEL